MIVAARLGSSPRLVTSRRISLRFELRAAAKRGGFAAMSPKIEINSAAKAALLVPIMSTRDHCRDCSTETALPLIAVGAESKAKEVTPPPPTARPLTSLMPGELTIPVKNGVLCTGSRIGSCFVGDVGSGTLMDMLHK